MAPAIEIRVLSSSGTALCRSGMFCLSVGCAVLLLLHGALWAAAAAAMLGAAVWITSDAPGITRLRLHDDGSCEVTGSDHQAEAQLDAVFSGWAFTVLRLKTFGRRDVFLVHAMDLAGSEAGQFRRWLKLSPLI